MVFFQKKKKMVLSERAKARLYDIHGEAYLVSALCDLHTNKTKGKTYNALIGNGFFSTIGDAISALTEYATIIMQTVVQGLREISWESVVVGGDVPIFLENMAFITKEILNATGERLRELLQSFFAGANQLWDYIESVIFTKIANLTREQIDRLRVPAEQVRALGALLVQYGASPIITVLKFFVRQIYNVVMGVISLFQKAVSFLAPIVGGLLVGFQNIVSSTEFQKILYGCIIFPFVAMQEVFEFLDGGLQILEIIISSIGVFLVDKIQFLTRMLSTIPKNLLDTLFSYEPLKKIGRFLKNSVNRVLTFLSSVLTRMGKYTIVNYLFSFVVAVKRQADEILGSIFSKIDLVFPEPELTKMRKELQSLSEYDDLNPNTKQDAKAVLNEVAEYESKLEDVLKKRFLEIVIGGYPEKLLTNIWKGTSMLVKIYFDEELSEEEVEDYIKIRFGMERHEMNEITERLGLKMLNMISRIEKEIETNKVKVESMLIGNLPPDLKSMQIEKLEQLETEKEKEIAQLLIDLEKSRENEAKSRNDETYINNMNVLYEKLNEELEKATKTRDKLIRSLKEETDPSIYRERYTKIEEIYNSQVKSAHTIHDADKQTQYELAGINHFIKEQENIRSAIKEVKNEIEIIQVQIRKVQNRIHYWTWIFAAIVYATIAAFQLYTYHKRSKEEAIRIQEESFSTLQAAIGFDPLLGTFVNKYARAVERRNKADKITPGKQADFMHFMFHDIVAKITSATPMGQKIKKPEDYNEVATTYESGGVQEEFLWDPDMSILQVQTYGQLFVNTAIRMTTTQLEAEKGSYINQVWLSLTQFNKKTDTTEIEIDEKKFARVVGKQLNLDLLKNVNLRDIATPWSSQKSEKEYRQDVATVLTAYIYLIDDAIRAEAKRIYDHDNDYITGILGYVSGAIHNKMKNYGVVSIGVNDTKLESFSQAIMEGRVTVVEQTGTMYWFWGNAIIHLGYLLWLVIFFLVCAIVCIATGNWAYVGVIGAQYITLDALKVLGTFTGLAVSTATKIAKIRSEAFFELFDVVSYMGMLIFPGYGIWKVAQALRKKKEDELVHQKKVDQKKKQPQKTKLGALVRCKLCSNSARLKEEEGQNSRNVYCSVGCAFLVYNGGKK